MDRQPQSLAVFNPKNLTKFMVFFSPVILATVIFSMTFIFQNPKGFIYLFLFFLVTAARNMLAPSSDENAQNPTRDNICTMIKYSDKSNIGYIIFIATFTAIYMFWPMIYKNDFNYLAVGGFMAYFITIIWVLVSSKCINGTNAFLNGFAGALTGAVILIIAALMNLNNYLFFNEISTNKDVCSMPSKQTFKCSVYKNGELVQTTDSS
jgi:hypothetical protein